MKFFASIIALLCWSDALLFFDRGTDQVGIHSSDMHPSWSPDGKYLTFYSDADGDYEIYILEVKTGARKQLTHSDGSDENRFGHQQESTSLFTLTEQATLKRHRSIN